MMRARLIGALAVGTLVSLGCASGGPDPELGAAPEPQTTMVTVNGAEVARESGVQLRVNPVSRTSRYQNEMDYKPVSVEIRNESGRPLKIHYDAFALAPEGGGDEFDAVPVHWLDKAGEGMPGIGGLPPNAWEYRAFRVADEYSEMFPDVPAYEGAFEVTSVDAYRADRPGMAESGALRDRELLADVIPEGVLESGGRIQGTMWFEEIEDADSALTFTMQLIDASTGEAFGEMVVPIDPRKAMVEMGTEMWEARAAGAADPVDVLVIVSAPDPATYAERRVQLDDVRVQKVVNDRVFWVGPDGGQWLLVTYGDPTAVGPITAAPIEQGQTVTLVGNLREPPLASVAQAEWRLDPTDAEMLGGSRLYLVAEDVQTD